MPDQTPTMQQPPTDELELEHDDSLHEQGELPRRPRRRFLQPLPVALLAALTAALGVLGGVLIEKGQQGSSTTAGGAGSSAFAAAFARRAAGGGGTGGGAAAGGAAAGGATGGGGFPGGGVTAGEVTYVNGGTLYVTGREGNTVKVTTSASSRVTKTVTAQVKSIHPGDTVLVQGEAGKNGAVSASSVSVTASGGSSKTSTSQTGSGGGAQALFGSGG